MNGLRAKVFKAEPGVWAFCVYRGDKVVFQDNGGTFDQNLAEALFLLEAVDNLSTRGYKLAYKGKQTKSFYDCQRVPEKI